MLHMVNLLRSRLITRGHRPSSIDPILRECYTTIRRKYPYKSNTSSAQSTSSIKDNNHSKRIFFHLPFHPKEISRATIQEFYNTSCNTDDMNEGSFKEGCYNHQGNKMVIEKLTVAYSRPKNLRDLLSPTTLTPPPNTTTK